MIWIGVDIAKRSFTAAQRSVEGPVRATFAMSEAGFEQFRRWLPQEALAVCLESTGPYWLPLAEWLEQAGLPYALVNALSVRRFAQARRQLSKTDALDAELLVLYAEAFQPPCVQTPEGPYRGLRALSRRILQLQRQLDLERDRREKASADPACPRSLQESFLHIETELACAIDTLEGTARSLIQQHPQLLQTWRLLRSIPGIGEKTARTLLAEYGPHLTSANPKQLTRFAGLDIVLHESGSSVHHQPRISKQGNWRIRRALFLAALTASRYNPTLAAYYQRKCSQGLAKKQALVAVMRKLLHLVHGVLKHQTPYQPNFQPTLA